MPNRLGWLAVLHGTGNMDAIADDQTPLYFIFEINFYGASFVSITLNAEANSVSFTIHSQHQPHLLNRATLLHHNRMIASEMLHHNFSLWEFT